MDSRILVPPLKFGAFKGAALTWKDPVTGQVFKAPFERILAAESEVNRMLILRGDIFYNEFLAYLGLDTEPVIDCYGWNVDGWSVYGYSYVDFDHYAITHGAETYFEFESPFPPHNIINEDLEPWLDLATGRRSQKIQAAW